jgi:hypothetical protein
MVILKHIFLFVFYSYGIGQDKHWEAGEWELGALTFARKDHGVLWKAGEEGTLLGCALF